MPKPHVICHMATSLDGRVWASRWSPKSGASDLFETIHERLDGDAWLIGRVTGSEFAKGKPYTAAPSENFPRTPWFATDSNAKDKTKAYGVVLDASGKIGWGRADIGGDPTVVVLTEAVSDTHLAGLRGDGVSYIFAGKTELDLRLALDILNRELGIKRLLLEGGGGVNGSFFRAGLIDEVSLILCPAIDGNRGAPIVFDGGDADGPRSPAKSMTLESTEPLDGGALWLRYRVGY